jgi:ABC-type lipoprotein release transport system permease subunit
LRAIKKRLKSLIHKRITILSVVFVFIFTTGLYPAKRATGISALNALRYE